MSVKEAYIIAVQVVFGLLIIGGLLTSELFEKRVKYVLIGCISFIIISGIISATAVSTCDSKENFFFELTPQKQCDGGPYMYSSNPAKKALCSKFSQSDLDRYECGRGYVGRPVWWNYSPESDSKWQNGRCSKIGVPEPDPQVL
jgi:hypothetical protein